MFVIVCCLQHHILEGKFFKYSVIKKCMHVANEFLLYHCSFDPFFQSISSLKKAVIALLDL